MSLKPIGQPGHGLRLCWASRPPAHLGSSHHAPSSRSKETLSLCQASVHRAGPNASPSPSLLRGFICHPQVTQSSRGKNRLLTRGTQEHTHGGRARSRTVVSGDRSRAEETANKGSGNKSRIHLRLGGLRAGQWLSPVLVVRLLGCTGVTGAEPPPPALGPWASRSPSQGLSFFTGADTVHSQRSK